MGAFGAIPAMIFFTLITGYIPYEQGERYALGENVQVSILAAIGGMTSLGLMLWYIRKTKKEKQRRPKKHGK